MKPAAEQVHDRLASVADPQHAKNLLWFFKTGPGDYGEGDRFLGLRSPQVRAAVREFRDLSLDDLGEVLRSPWHEERLLALLVLVWSYPRSEKREQNAIYRFYLRNTRFINNWDLVDLSAPNIVGAHLLTRDRAVLRKLARSRSLWERRIAVLATFAFIAERDFDDALAIGTMLLVDEHDLIHKAVGWMLREIGKRDEASLHNFLQQHAATMHRTMLRYAIEKMPEKVRQGYLRARKGGGG